MKIIKKGIVDSETKRFECKACGCIFEADNTEYCESYSMELVLGCSPAYKCVCPTCKKLVYTY